MDNKSIKDELKKKAFREPEKYYPTEALNELGYIKNNCNKCKRLFYAAEKKVICNDPNCSGGFRFIGNTPARNKLDYIQAWTVFADIMGKQGYTPIKRYPSVARWRDDEYWVGASIYDFQPYVVSGEVEPPANPLVVPQFCLRFNDVDNIGITGAHYSCFIMQGQHAFVPAGEYDTNKYLMDLHKWFMDGIKIPKKELYIHPDSWAGGGNAGVSLEFFSRGLEIANQVYMQYQIETSGLKELNIKVLDMGQGQERVAWFTQGKPTSYEATFPTVVEKLKKLTGVKADEKLMEKFLPYSSYLNIDEVEDIDKVWRQVAKKINYDPNELKKKISELAAVYSIAEHSRALLVALTDGALPSNTGGGYNLRVLLRRALSFIDKYKWNIDLAELCSWHASYLKPLFPELKENPEQVNKILDVEISKFNATKQKTGSIISKLVKEDKEEIDDKKLLQLYDSQGISPEIVKEEALKLGKKILVPENFYARAAKLHEKQEQHKEEKEKHLDLKGVKETNALYFEDYKKLKFRANIAKTVGRYVVLDKTYFYPTSGGQIHDTGTIAGEKVVNVFKGGNIIVHELSGKHKFPEGEEVECEINKERRFQLAKHHTATHIINAAARKVLGNHINQAGAKKDVDKASIDITHYQALSENELKKIEEEANRIVKGSISVISQFYPRTKAEQTFGMRIYQGGVVPGKQLRIVDITGIDVEACGGTHLKNTSEAGKIKLLKATKISDSIIRIYFTAGEAARKESAEQEQILEEASALLGVKKEQLPGRVNELFEKWKRARKAVKKGVELKPEELELKSTEVSKGDALEEMCKILRTQPEHVNKTIKRFVGELRGFGKK